MDNGINREIIGNYQYNLAAPGHERWIGDFTEQGVSKLLRELRTLSVIPDDLSILAGKSILDGSAYNASYISSIVKNIVSEYPLPKSGMSLGIQICVNDMAYMHEGNIQPLLAYADLTINELMKDIRVSNNFSFHKSSEDFITLTPDNLNGKKQTLIIERLGALWYLKNRTQFMQYGLNVKNLLDTDGTLLIDARGTNRSNGISSAEHAKYLVGGLANIDDVSINYFVEEHFGLKAQFIQFANSSVDEPFKKIWIWKNQ